MKCKKISKISMKPEAPSKKRLYNSKIFSAKLAKLYASSHLSLVVRKPAFCICENKDADQLRGNREANQRLCFCYRDTCSTIPLLSKYEITSLLPSSVAVQPSLCGTWSKTPKTGFLTMNLICKFTFMRKVFCSLI